jgi:hypothetical protein
VSGCDYSPLKAALEKLTIYDVWQMLGVEGRPKPSCKSPFRPERNASFSIYAKGRRWKDHKTGEGRDAADFCAKARGLSPEDGTRLLIELAGTKRANPGLKGNGGNAKWQGDPSRPGNPDPYDPLKDKEKARKREGWPVFEAPTQAEIGKVAMLRGLSLEGVSLAAERGLLLCADSREGRAWVIADCRRRNAQARRLDGHPWARIGDKKAWTLPGSEAAWPIGLREASPFPAIALVEGGPDLLAAFHLAWCDGVEERVAAVAMMGASNRIPEDAFPFFAGKRVRIFPHHEKAGSDAGKLWARQLITAGVKVDGFSFAGFIRTDGLPVNDLNDFARVHPDQWEAERDAIEVAFSFATGSPQEGDSAVDDIPERDAIAAQ